MELKKNYFNKNKVLLIGGLLFIFLLFIVSSYEAPFDQCVTVQNSPDGLNCTFTDSIQTTLMTFTGSNTHCVNINESYPEGIYDYNVSCTDGSRTYNYSGLSFVVDTPCQEGYKVIGYYSNNTAICILEEDPLWAGNYSDFLDLISRVDTINSTLQSTIDRVDTLNSSQITIQQNLSLVYSNITDIYNNISSVLSEIDEVNDSINSVNISLTTQISRINSLNSSIIWIEDFLDTLEFNPTMFTNESGSWSINTTWFQNEGSNYWCELTGCNMTGDIDMNGNEIWDIDHLHFNVTSCTDPEVHGSGTMCWNPDEDTLNIVRENGQVVQVGKELSEDFRNMVGSAVSEGSVVYTTRTSTGDNPEFKLADSSNNSEMRNIGVLTTDCVIGATCPVTFFGFVNELNTSGFTQGDFLYVDSSTPGELTSTVPTLPNNPVWVGTVVRVHSNQGRIFVNPQIDSSDGFLINDIWATGSIYTDGSLNATIAYIDGNVTAGLFKSTLDKYCNATACYSMFDLLNLGDDITAPTINIINPENNVDENSLPVTIRISTNEISTCYYYYDSDDRELLGINSTSFSKDIVPEQGEHTLYFTCEDLVGNERATETITFNVNTINDGGESSSNISTVRGPLSSMELNYDENWIVGEKQNIIVTLKDSEGRGVDVDNVTIISKDLLNILKNIERTSEGVYKISVTVRNESLEQTEFEIKAIDNSISKTKNIAVTLTVQSQFDLFKQGFMERMETLFDYIAIYKWYLLGILTLVLITTILIILYKK